MRAKTTKPAILGSLCDPPDGGDAAPGAVWLRVEYLSTGEPPEDLSLKSLIEPPEDQSLVPGRFRSLVLRFENPSGGRWRLTGVVVPGEELTARKLRLLPLGLLTDYAVELVATATDTPPPRVAAPRKRARAGYEDDFYRDLAGLYRDACDHPEPGYRGKPIKWLVEKGYDYGSKRRPKRTWISNRLDEARRRGFLTREPGKAGYVDTPHPNDKEAT